MLYVKFALAVLVFYIGMFIMNMVGVALVRSIFKNKISTTVSFSIGYFIGYVVPLYFASLILLSADKSLVFVYLVILGIYDIYRTVIDPKLIATYTEDIRRGHIIGSSVAFLTLIIVFTII